ncbi:MAG: DHH family phosphoesterase [Spirochaetales bacterium]
MDSELPAERSFDALLLNLQVGSRILLQTHDFPDFDAIASAYGLFCLFETYGLPSTIVYGEEIQGFSLGETIRTLKIPVTRMKDLISRDDDQIIVVDSCPGNKNVTLLPRGTIKAVIDHHPLPSQPVATSYCDIREGYGSCSTMIYEYYAGSSFQPSKTTATALLMGIMMDTNYLTRGVGPADLEAFTGLYFKADWITGNYLLNNSLSVRNVPIFQEGFEHMRVYKGFCFTFISKETDSDTIAVMADDYLRFHEVAFSVVCGLNQGELKISVRSEDPGLAASKVVRRALDGIGFGGGHVHMGGGTVHLTNFHGPDDLYERFRAAIDHYIHEAT